MQEGPNARQQVVERIRQSTSILVAVGSNPSVDALAASLGLSLMLNKMNKHTTAVFSGQTPPAIQFLEPNKLFENNVDALRDFIISLDKEKADRLRYKVEDDVVRIFITPYKTSISEKDLQYSQGDFNVDLIIALGVEKRDDLDQAIVSHGRILHDATVITVNNNSQKSSLGSIDWTDAAASSLCEMLVGISETFQQPGLLDQQISTALLTGIVANTERFSNAKTSPRVMTMAAQLMAAGANQQLISSNLEKQQTAALKAAENAGPMAKQQPTAVPTPMPQEPPKKKEPGELDIVHEKQPEPPKSAEPVKAEPAVVPAPTASVAPAPQAEAELEAALPAAQVTHTMLPDLQKDLEEEAKKFEAAEESTEAAPGGKSVNAEVVKSDPEKEEDYISSHGSWKGKRLEPPTLGGTLNATTEEAMAANKKAEDEDHNKVLLTHPNDARPEQPRSKRNRRGRGGNKDNNGQPQQNNNAQNNSQPAPTVAPLPPPAPIQVTMPAPPEQPAPAPEPEQPQPMMAPAPLPEPTPVMPPQPSMPEPAPAVSDLPPVPPTPQLPPFPAEPAPAPVAETPALPEPPPTQSADDLNTLHQEVEQSVAEAAAAAQPADTATSTIDSARQAVSDALGAVPFNPAHQPLESAGAQAVPAMPNMPVTEPLSNDALQSLPPAPVAAAPIPESPVAPAPSASDLPPLPPMPPLPSSDMALPPAPDLPGLNGPLPPLAQTPPPAAPAPDDPRQYKIPGAP
jgi:hypothetical protein